MPQPIVGKRPPRTRGAASPSIKNQLLQGFAPLSPLSLHLVPQRAGEAHPAQRHENEHHAYHHVSVGETTSRVENRERSHENRERNQ